MNRFSVDVPVPSIDGRWDEESAAAFLGKGLRLKVGADDRTATVVGVELAPDGLTVRLELEADIAIPDGYEPRATEYEQDGPDPG
ncbi:hypothetical protein [Streptomyces sp. NBC_00212]|uniref:hypothetical protein n=1 Tax=Streptomyces sp. NBC_00212 TaxID=2975684 RepID=UPI002F9088FD